MLWCRSLWLHEGVFFEAFSAPYMWWEEPVKQSILTIPDTSSIICVFPISTFASVENGAALIGTAQLLRVVEHLCPPAVWTILGNDGFSLEILHVDSLHR